MTNFYFIQDLIMFHGDNFYFMSLGERFLHLHCSCVKSASALIFPAFLLCFLVLPTHCSLITLYTMFRVWQVCVKSVLLTHSLGLLGRWGLCTPPDWRSFQTCLILSTNCAWLACTVNTVMINVDFAALCEYKKNNECRFDGCQVMVVWCIWQE